MMRQIKSKEIYLIEVFMLDCIRNTNKNHIIPRCSDQGCKIKNINGNYVILDGDNLCTKNKSCDCIIFEDPYKQRIFLIELKSRMQNIGDIKEKFKNSSQKSMEIVNGCCSESHIPKFYHILVTKKSLRPIELRKLKSEKIRINGINYPIMYRKSHCSFCEIVEN